ncbi:hypothetical protein [Photobacterium damselae]|uniref:hypothetical protein n=1 Tax=Photobacterium damselae TaxID=38293 RepID=UPI001C4003FE|nr:hypothetical protein [Photobacterium damselae]
MNMEFRPVITKFKSFFANKQRVARLKKLLPKSATERELELALIAASLKLETPTFTKFQVSFYQDPIDAVYKALGVH